MMLAKLSSAILVLIFLFPFALHLSNASETAENQNMSSMKLLSYSQKRMLQNRDRDERGHRRREDDTDDTDDTDDDDNQAATSSSTTAESGNGHGNHHGRNGGRDHGAAGTDSANGGTSESSYSGHRNPGNNPEASSSSSNNTNNRIPNPGQDGYPQEDSHPLRTFVLVVIGIVLCVKYRENLFGVKNSNMEGREMNANSNNHNAIIDLEAPARGEISNSQARYLEMRPVAREDY